MCLRTVDIELNEDDFFFIRHGVEHKPIAGDEIHAMGFEPASTLNIRNIRKEFTREPVASCS